jgi:glycosyltransferase involved in cell wall biosynthesis
LMDAIPLINDTFKITIIGYGPLEKEIIGQCRKDDVNGKIDFLGKIDNAGAVIHYFDGIIIPSRYEGMPFICLEAMAAGVPIVATPAVGITDLISNETAYMAEDFSAEKLAQAITACLADIKTGEKNIEKMAEINREKIEQEFSREKNVDLMRSLYRSL